MYDYYVINVEYDWFTAAAAADIMNKSNTIIYQILTA